MIAFALVTKQAPASAEPSVSLAPAPSAAVVAPPTTQPPATSGDPSASGLPARNAAAEPFPVLPVFDWPAGETRLVPPGPAPAMVTVTLPDGWSRAGTTMVLRRSGPDGGGMLVSVSAWQVRQVDTYACRWASQPRSVTASTDPAATQAQTLSQWWGQDPGNLPDWNSPLAPLASKPQATTIAGHPAWTLDVLIPRGLDLAECDGGQLVLWEAANSDVRFGLPGELHRLWVVNVEGGPLVVDAASFANASSAELDELQAVIDSIVIEP